MKARRLARSLTYGSSAALVVSILLDTTTVVPWQTSLIFGLVFGFVLGLWVWYEP